MFTRNSRGLSVSRAQKMEQLRVFAVWHHKWKLLGQNHDIYNHYTSTKIYTLRLYKGFFFGTSCDIQLSLLLPVIRFGVIHSKTLPYTKSNVAFSAVRCVVHCFIVFPVCLLVLSAHTTHRDFPSSLACVTRILYINCSLPSNVLASLLVWPLTLNFLYGISEQSFGDFFSRKFPVTFFPCLIWLLHRCYSVRTSSIMRGTYPKTLEQKLHVPQKGPACSLPACARFRLENFLFLASTTAADSEGWICFALFFWWHTVILKLW
jgi:hypothetical protein